MMFPPRELRRPRRLTRDGHVAVLAISSPSSSDRIEQARRNLEQRGLRVTFAENLFDRVNAYLAGDDATRLREINRFLRSDEFDAFFFARGGYGAMRILDQIDYGAVAANPRPMIGYSDLTALHQAVATRAGVTAFHGPMMNTDFFEGLSSEHESWFWSMLAGEAPLTHRFNASQVVSHGRGDGILFGGCLSLTTALTSTPFDYWVEDGIWFWEEVSEPVYRIDRMLTHLRLSGRLAAIRGVMIGRLKECGEDRPADVDALLSEFFGDAGIPVVRDLPFGHFANNLLLPLGARIELDTSTCTLTFPNPAVLTFD